MSEHYSPGAIADLLGEIRKRHTRTTPGIITKALEALATGEDEKMPSHAELEAAETDLRSMPDGSGVAYQYRNEYGHITGQDVFLEIGANTRPRQDGDLTLTLNSSKARSAIESWSWAQKLEKMGPPEVRSPVEIAGAARS